MTTDLRLNIHSLLKIFRVFHNYILFFKTRYNYLIVWTEYRTQSISIESKSLELLNVHTSLLAIWEEFAMHSLTVIINNAEQFTADYITISDFFDFFFSSNITRCSSKEKENFSFLLTTLIVRTHFFMPSP